MRLRNYKRGLGMDDELNQIGREVRMGIKRWRVEEAKLWI
jgi:hypothetical protein